MSRGAFEVDGSFSGRRGSVISVLTHLIQVLNELLTRTFNQQQGEKQMIKYRIKLVYLFISPIYIQTYTMPPPSIASILLLLTFLTLSQQTSLNTLNKQCLCDITDQCDYECCCDTSCDSTLLTQWQTYRLCLDDNFGIPFCSRLTQTQTNVLDLHSGLRTIYSVIQRLFCITTVNFVQPEDWYDKTIQDIDLQTELQSISTAQSQSVLNPDILAETQFPISGLPLKSSNGLCRSSSQITKNNQQSSSCRVYVSSSNDVNSSLLSIAKLQSSLGVSLQKYDSKTVSTGSVTAQNLNTSCSSGQCSNVIRQVKIFINSNNGSIDSSSYIVVGPLKVDQAGYINIDYQYSFIIIQNSQVIFPYSSKIGYQFGSPLNLLYKDSTLQFYKIFTPISLAFRKPDGTCRTSAIDDAANSFVELNFGSNQVLSCYGSTNLIYENLKQVFNYFGKYGVSSTKLSEYVNVTIPSTAISSSESVQLLIYYINIGIPQNPQYEISKVQLNAVTSKNGLSTLYVEYVSVGNEFNLYLPPAPTVDAYLPNDFLYPFFVA